MRTENLDFIDALKLLADNAGIIIPEDDGNFSDASHEKKKRILAMNKLSARFFYNCLRDKNIGEKGQKYFAKRLRYTAWDMHPKDTIICLNI